MKKREIVLLFLFGLHYANAKAQSELDTVLINLGWKNQFEFAGFYAAKELGFYKDEGIEVEFFVPDNLNYYTFPINNEFDYFVASAGRILELENRNNYLITNVIFQQSPISFIVRNEDNITYLKELEGKKIGSGTEIKAMLKVAGADLNTIDFSKPTTDVNLVISRKLDGISSYINDVYMHDVVEKNFKVFRPIEYGINFYSDCLVTTQQELQENPKRVHKIREATIKGWEYAIKHPQEIVELIHTKYNSNLSLDDLKKESEIVLNSLLIPNLYVFGTSDKMRWENMNKVLIDLKIIKVPLDLNRLLYNPKTENTEQLRYFLKIALLVLMVIGIILLVAIFYNFQLKKAIAKKTLELKNINIELENLNMFRAKMLAMISHDTKGPIHNLKGIIHLFNNGSLDLESFKKLFLEVENKLDEVSMFLDNILRWSKQNFHKNEQTINTKKLELTAITQKIISLFSFEIKKKSINIENNIDTNVLLFADENMLNTILRNLLSNAIKFSNFEGNIKIYTTPCENGIKVNIKDNGMGMTESQLKDIFTENVISTEGSKQEVGTGLGLLLCKQYAELHNGKIGAESQLNKGSTFWFELPLEPTPAVTMHRE